MALALLAGWERYPAVNLRVLSQAAPAGEHASRTGGKGLFFPEAFIPPHDAWLDVGNREGHRRFIRG